MCTQKLLTAKEKLGNYAGKHYTCEHLSSDGFDSDGPPPCKKQTSNGFDSDGPPPCMKQTSNGFDSDGPPPCKKQKLMPAGKKLLRQRKEYVA